MQMRFNRPQMDLYRNFEASKFITGRKTMELIKKLEGCTSKYQAGSLHRQVIVKDRIKNMHESIYYNVDKLHQAIANKKQISFKYMEWTIDKDEKFRKNGVKYVENPCSLCWDNDNYYLVTYNSKHKKNLHYRVDRMAEVTVLDTTCELCEENKRQMSKCSLINLCQELLLTDSVRMLQLKRRTTIILLSVLILQ